MLFLAADTFLQSGKLLLLTNLVATCHCVLPTAHRPAQLHEQPQQWRAWQELMIKVEESHLLLQWTTHQLCQAQLLCKGKDKGKGARKDVMPGTISRVVCITYCWTENNQPRCHISTATSPQQRTLRRSKA